LTAVALSLTDELPALKKRNPLINNNIATVALKLL